MVRSARPGVENVVQRLAYDGMMPAEPEDAETGEHVQVVASLVVVEVGAFGAGVDAVESDRVQHSRQLGVEVTGVQFVPLGAAAPQDCSQVERFVAPHAAGRASLVVPRRVGPGESPVRPPLAFGGATRRLHPILIYR